MSLIISPSCFFNLYMEIICQFVVLSLGNTSVTCLHDHNFSFQHFRQMSPSYSTSMCQSIESRGLLASLPPIGEARHLAPVKRPSLPQSPKENCGLVCTCNSAITASFNVLAKSLFTANPVIRRYKVWPTESVENHKETNKHVTVSAFSKRERQRKWSDI
jgi:hypothetical protein